jgi:hypothetical protein
MSDRSVTRSGALLSVISTGIPMTPLGNAVAESPSLFVRAPIPPAADIVNEKEPPAGSDPRNCVSQMFAAPSATTLPPMTGASALMMAIGRKWPMMCRAASGAGHVALRMLPGGALTVTGRREPVLFGMSAPMRQLIAYVVYACV